MGSEVHYTRTDARGTPLWPAGHLPLKGGDWRFLRRWAPSDLGDWRKRKQQPISPLEGEMPGRAEGGGLAPTLCG
ncbi:MAG: lytic murein transglycosylase [Mesorhizobium sp.]|nr:MAG: lytic murein transglycosylase [Mesorhizobium sp.]RWD79457.1 MAG: lytic murein transglycosylase [Mesorhizobium sp.]